MRPSLATLPRRLVAPVCALALLASTPVGADESTSAVPADLPTAADIAVDGTALEAILAEVGLDAAWRATVGLGDLPRNMTINYVGGEAAAPIALVESTFEITALTAQHAAALEEVRTVADRLNDARDAERDAEIIRNRADAHQRGTEALTQAVAVGMYEGGDTTVEAILGLDALALTEAHRTAELTDHTVDEMLTRLAAANVALELAIASHEDTIERRKTLTTLHELRRAEAADLSIRRRDAESAARDLLPDAAAAFSLAAVPGQPGLTPRAIHAYIEAELVLAEERPGCRVSWRTLAAVGSVEGLHGAYQGRRLDVTGVPNDPVIGIRLDGRRTDNFGDTVASFVDTDNGRWDGDTVFDRAVGPMQFIPDTWERWRRDADRDGETDPHDLDDAALTAAAYLCNYGSLRTWDVWSTAIYGYNHSAAYVNSVKESLDRVARLRLPRLEDGPRLQQVTPYGEWVPMEDPEEEPIEGEPPLDGTAPPAPLPLPDPATPPAPETPPAPDTPSAGEVVSEPPAATE